VSYTKLSERNMLRLNISTLLLSGVASNADCAELPFNAESAEYCVAMADRLIEIIEGGGVD
jgi:hypothetical protein